MNKHCLPAIFALLWITFTAAAQPTGAMYGYVRGQDGAAAEAATIRLDNYDLAIHTLRQPGPYGYFSFHGLPVALYNVTITCPEYGFYFDTLRINSGDSLSVVFSLLPAHGDTLTEATIRGNAVVEPPNELHSWTWYFLDVNNDQAGDYRLCFGPPWYNPPGVDRPQNGDLIEVQSGLFSYAEVPMMIVHHLSNSLWRDPLSGNGGYGGTQGFLSLMCHTLDTSGTGGLINPPRIEIMGTPEYDLCWPPDTTTPPGVYDFWAPDSLFGATWHVNFGSNPSYYCESGTEYFVVGGLVQVENDEIPWVIPYEVNGEFWREPGDTTGLAPMGNAAHDVPDLHPSSFSLSAYPNPFNSTTQISFTLPHAEQITLRVYDLLGRVVETLAYGQWQAGEHRITYSAEHLGSGIYFARLETATLNVTQKLVILK